MKNFLDRASDYKSSVNNFKFYVSASQDLQGLSLSDEDIAFQKARPKLLDGEIIITEGNRVLYFPNVVDKTKGLLGNLYVTNFRFIFDAYEDDNSSDDVHLHQVNQLLGCYSSCLTNIECLYQITGEKKKKLFQDSQLIEKVKGLQIVCKNLKVFTFNFDQSFVMQGKSIAKTLLHHAFPGRHQLLFAYDFRSNNFKPGKLAENVLLFLKRSDWECELLRTSSTSASNWRISTQNQGFQMSTSLPQWLIVPHSLLDYDFVTASQSFRCNRPPVWTWSSPNGAALIRTADLLPTITDRTQENKMLENIRKCHPQLKGPCLKDLDKDLPSIGELFQSYSKLRELSLPDSYHQFKTQDSHLYSILDNSKWLHYISNCLKASVEAVLEIRKGITVVLQESDGRDTSAIISSLVQLILDPHTRTIAGFQSLIQKEWIALGHPFCKRLGFLKVNNSEQSPVFLLFLDCVWQLQNQFPSCFEFTETYLTTLWDSVHVSLFDTFLFDCEKDRADAFVNPNEKLEPRSLWNWNFQFSESDIELFFNPLFTFQQLKDLTFGAADCELQKSDSVLLPEFSLPYIKLWMQCYFRWLPLLSIRSGGSPQIDIIHRHLMADIQSLISEIQEQAKLNLEDGALNTINSINNNLNGNNNSSNLKNNKKNNITCSTKSVCEKSASNNVEKKFDWSNVISTTNRNYNYQDIAVLFTHKDALDNFFPFSRGDTNYVTSGMGNSSNISELDTSSVLNATD